MPQPGHIVGDFYFRVTGQVAAVRADDGGCRGNVRRQPLTVGGRDEDVRPAVGEQYRDCDELRVETPRSGKGQSVVHPSENTMRRLLGNDSLERLHGFWPLQVFTICIADVVPQQPNAMGFRAKCCRA